MSQMDDLAYLKNKLSVKQNRVKLRYKYYEMKNSVPDFGISSPPALRKYKSVMGWCADAVDAIADRLQFYQFENDTFDFAEIFRMNNQEILIDSLILSSLIGSCSFAYIYKDDQDAVRIQAIDGCNATGIIDPSTYMLKSGYAILEKDKNGNPVMEAYFTPENTAFYEGGKLFKVVKNPAKYPLLVPFVYKPDAARPFGHSVISRACMSSVEGASRTIKRAEISAEFYSFPQKYVTGLDPEADVMDKWMSAMSAMLTFDKDEDGNHPLVGQFQAASMSPHIEQLRMYAAKFSGETGLTMDDLGFVSDNPSSVEAIKAAHERLRLKCRKAQAYFSTGLINIGYVARSLADEIAYNRDLIYDTKVIWEPLFEPDAAMLSGIGDGVMKINQSVPGYIGEKGMRELTGIRKDS